MGLKKGKLHGASHLLRFPVVGMPEIGIAETVDPVAEIWRLQPLAELDPWKTTLT
jgi:hypothetical protein